MNITVVVPVYNESESLANLHRELSVALAELGPAEFVFVDDGSNDGSWSRIRALSENDERVRGVRLRRNFGKAAALMAGFRASRGDIVFTLDADLQDDPAEMPKFLDALASGFDVVSGWKRVRHDPWHKVIPSRVFNALVSRLTGCHLHDHNCGFKAYRRQVIEEVEVYGELHRFIPVLAHAQGFKVGELVVNHRPRRYGRSKYGFSRLMKGFLDILTVRFLTGFGHRPLHVLGGIGLVLFGLGFLGLLFLAVEWLRGHGPIGTRPLLVYSATLLGVGAQILCLGILAELVTSYHVRSHPTYSIAETVGDEPAASLAHLTEAKDEA
jgi:glycosyltransferase involved in cell wall biosynthesis